MSNTKIPVSINICASVSVLIMALFIYMPPFCIGTAQYVPYMEGPGYMYSLHYMTKRGKLPGVMIYLWLYPEEVNDFGNNYEVSPLVLALDNDHFRTADYIISKGGTIRTYSRKSGAREGGPSALFLEAVKGPPDPRRTEYARKMVEGGMDVNMRGEPWPPIYSAAWAGNEEIVKLLIERGADVNAQAKNGETALMKLICFPEIFNYLLDHGADVTIVDASGENILHKIVKAECPNSHTIEFLQKTIDKGADVNLSNENGKTPLDTAMMQTPQKVEKLLTNGANPFLRDDNGLSTFDYCIPFNAALARSWICDELKRLKPEDYARIEEQKRLEMEEKGEAQ